MRAKLLLRERWVIAEDRFADLVIWQLPSPAPGSAHSFKYRLSFMVGGQCMVRFDNEAGKGDHKHVGSQQVSYRFKSIETLVEDFWRDIEAWRPQ